MDYDWDERWEPAYDPGPDPEPLHGDCDECGVVDDLSDNGLCADCEADAIEDERRWEDYHDDPCGLIDGVGFADPGGRSALRAATPSNPRIHPCPNCGAPDVLTPADVARGYQCDRCADLAERGGW